jgi:lipoate-protein ligase A
MDGRLMWIDDQIIGECARTHYLSIWVPEKPLVILGSSNDGERECHLAHCKRDGVPVLRRRGGGGAVVLHPECVVVSFGAWVGEYYQNKKYFSLLNRSLITGLQKAYPKLPPIEERGISDLAMGDKKIAGTSLFRSRNYLLYQASLLAQPGLSWIETYLAHPSIEPDYRQGKPHREFIVGLGVSPPELAAALSGVLEDCFLTLLKGDLIPPQRDQIDYLLANRKGEDL